MTPPTLTRLAVLLLASLCATLALLLAGCGGVPEGNGEATAAIAVIDAIDADTEEAITVEATAVCGGVRGTITVEEGSVVLRDVPFGTETDPTQPLTVTAPGYVTFAERIEISTTVATFYTVTLEPADLANTGTVTGTITDSGGTPVTSALVKFTQVTVGGTTEVSGYTDSQGVYKIGGIPTGVNTMTAEASGCITGSQQVTVVQDAGGGINADSSLALISGSTTIAVSGLVTDAFDATPLPGATVVFGDFATVTTNASGAFSLANVPVGTYSVTITLTGYDKAEETVEVLPGMGIVRFALTTTAPEPPTGPYNLQGTVTLNGAADNSGASVTATSISTAQDVASVTTPASGLYTMFLPAGSYRLTVAYGGRSVRRTVVVPGGGRVLTGIDFVLTVGTTTSSAKARAVRHR